jgi:hypothetical protein
MATKRKFKFNQFDDTEKVLVINLLNRTNLFLPIAPSLENKLLEHDVTFDFGEFNISYTNSYLSMNDYLLYVFILKKWILANEGAAKYLSNFEISFEDVITFFNKKDKYSKDLKKRYDSFNKSLGRLKNVKIRFNSGVQIENIDHCLLDDSSYFCHEKEVLIATIPSFIKAQYNEFNYAFINFDWFKMIKTQRAKALYRFLITHSKSFNTHSFFFLKKLLNLAEDEGRAHDQINAAFKELRTLDLLENIKVNKKSKSGKKRNISSFTYSSSTKIQLVEFYRETVRMAKKEKKDQAIMDNKKFEFTEPPKPSPPPSNSGNRIFRDLYDDIPF